MKASYRKRCGCKDPETGKQLGSRCPRLAGRRHGTWGYDTRLDLTGQDGQRLKRYGFATQRQAEEDFYRVREMLNLAGADDALRRRIGDLIVERTKRRGQLPTVEEVRRKLGAGVEVDAASMTVAEGLDEWLAGKRSLKASTRRSYQQHIEHYLKPILGGIAEDRLRPSHISGMLDTIAEMNEEIVAARDEDREPNLPEDARKRANIVGVATQRRIVATLRNYLNYAMKQRRIDHNPVLAVELPTERRDPARVWGPAEIGKFLEAAEGDRLGLLFRLVLLRGFRRGEVCGLRHEDLDLDAGCATVRQTVLQLGGKVVFDTPKTDAGERVVSLDRATVQLLKDHVDAQRRERFAWGRAYEDHGLVFCRENGTPVPPDRVSARFREIAKEAGLPVIKLHEGRHTAATLALEAGIDVRLVSDQLGHSTTRITSDLYQHVRRTVASDAAEKVVALLPGHKDTEETAR